MPFSCCHLRTAVRTRDMDILQAVKSYVREGAIGNFGIFRAIKARFQSFKTSFINIRKRFFEALKRKTTMNALLLYLVTFRE